MWKISVEKDGQFVDTGIRIEKDPDFWINQQHLLDGKSYSAEQYRPGVLGGVKTAWAKLRNWL
jgi:hypothetical protein